MVNEPGPEERRSFGTFGGAEKGNVETNENRPPSSAENRPPSTGLPKRGRGGSFGGSGFGAKTNLLNKEGDVGAADQQKEASPQPEQQDQSESAKPNPTSSFGARGGGMGGGFKRGGGSGFGQRQAEGASGADFGDRTPGTGANNAPLGTGGGGGRGGGFTGRGGGFGGRGGGFGRGGAFAASGGANTDGAANENTGGGGGGFSKSTGFSSARGGGGFSSGGGTGFGARGGSSFSGGGGFGGRGGGFGGRGGGSSFGNAGSGGDRQSRFGGGDRDFGDGGSRAGDRPFRPYTDEERAKEASHVPVDRTIQEIVDEDLKVSDTYKTICEEDEDCTVTGLADGAAQQVLDKWEDANFEPKVKENIERAGYICPRKIQQLTIPLIQDGHDIKGHAETGSGKSAAFLLPLIDGIMKKKTAGTYESKRICPYALIIEPTRELAIQLYDQARKLAEGTGVSVSKAYGKFALKANIREISTQGCDILVGTPGRLTDLFESKYLEFDNLKVLVLDEADQLLEDDFARELRKLTKMKEWPKNEDRQTLLFSATFPPEVQEWAKEWMKKDNLMVSNRKLVNANSRVVQKFMKVSKPEKNDTLLQLLLKEEKDAKQENPANPAVKRTMIFVQLRRTADVLSSFLNMNGQKSTTINGDRPQKLREQSLNEFRAGKYNIVVTTDVCARGIDIKDLDHVINYDLPLDNDYVSYVHRVGRTGRLKEGTATSFFDPVENMELAKQLVKGLHDVSQEVPEWLQLAADGKLPVDEPVSTGWGNSAFAFGANKLVEENVEAAAAAPAENGHAAEQNGDTKPAEVVKENGVNGTASASPSPAAQANQEQPPPTPKQQEVPKSTGVAAAAASENDDW